MWGSLYSDLTEVAVGGFSEADSSGSHLFPPDPCAFRKLHTVFRANLPNHLLAAASHKDAIPSAIAFKIESLFAVNSCLLASQSASL